MATNFPSSLDSFTNPTAVDTLDSPPHDTQHADANDAIEALQAKVGVDGSAVTTSIDYQLNTGYRYHSTVYFTSSGTFTKASYPWLRAIKVYGVGGGGGGGYAGGTAAGAGGGGGAGAYAETFITDIAGLASSVTVTVGSGGTGGVASTSTAPTNGTDSSFGSLMVADAGLYAASVDTNITPFTAKGSPGGTSAASTGDFKQDGGDGTFGILADTGTYYEVCGGTGGASRLGGGGRGGQGDNDGDDAGNYGGGGGGGGERTTGGRNGGAGGPGIVIVELYA